MNYLKKIGLYMTYSLSVIWSLFAIGYITAVTFITIPIGNDRVVDQVLGFIMGTIVAGVMQFWTGSSLGSKEKEAAQQATKETKDEPIV